MSSFLATSRFVFYSPPPPPPPPPPTTHTHTHTHIHTHTHTQHTAHTHRCMWDESVDVVCGRRHVLEGVLCVGEYYAVLITVFIAMSPLRLSVPADLVEEPETKALEKALPTDPSTALALLKSCGVCSTVVFAWKHPLTCNVVICVYSSFKLLYTSDLDGKGKQCSCVCGPSTTSQSAVVIGHGVVTPYVELRPGSQSLIWVWQGCGLPHYSENVT